MTAPGYILLLGFMPMLFPDGHPPSPRWRPAAWFLGAAMAVGAVVIAVAPGPLDLLPQVENPFAVGGGQSAEAAEAVAGLLLLSSLLVAAAALVTRLVRSRGRERQQLKLFAYPVAVGIASNALPLGPVGDAANFVSIVVFPVAIGVAILRHRLYDIDRLINRTVVYALLTAVLALAYVAGVVLLRQVTSSFTGTSSLAVAGSTLAVAALFGPLRRRVQEAVDRRFDRRKYDAAQTIGAFAVRLRAEVDLDALTSELLAVADRTVQPTQVFLWLRPTPGPRTASWSP